MSVIQSVQPIQPPSQISPSTPKPVSSESTQTPPSSGLEQDHINVKVKTGLLPSTKGFLAGAAPSAVIGAGVGAALGLLFGQVKMGAALGGISGSLAGGVAGAISANMSPEELKNGGQKKIFNAGLGTGAVSSFVLGMTVSLFTTPVGIAAGQAVAEPLPLK
ncbi:hypothetical protein COW36_22100 [bacterium (Candidatus Blackallbacteria) CG17_big_fil_post_rev_8_21_14_2_50_48_46]|uniref:Glycine zipper domain-containing protein n=1 Tax=bacterium (Candidatus Blackallbacteria) CG17_big_fil_post_rev_8_21_14_2_50_48_46 TaxID=2014261 RepID=A0A2M7FYC7_9BACT|nr:MAG: hypothetical protein COW64_13530 [bacterium (Candidatus Blackallbacteria) CG18_big_fil_WC_8_21_14_2_50_49_26]PIW14311.1 MAG: hypothetical protein COW36_22100 [bacterium (Candidatus Blackallbacteria) CG17_big_fil_post_rev_8_21_14_2_50_48_46]PIW45580.1 MAG: hypothetical protein COW20_19705 [bacterium (Candidatus Blackallbacteria) CG13_big_fil_rev_8_21_14_2_50_49_14]